MLEDVLNKPWCTKLITYKDLHDLTTQLDTKLVKMVEAKERKLQPHGQLTIGAAPDRERP